MPLLDVSDAFALDFMDDFLVQRRAASVSSTGRNQTAVTYFETCGVITAASGADLERMPEVDVSPRSIVIVTQFRLQINSPGFKPDIVQWAGNNYLVQHVDDYSRYGQGFIQAIAASIDYLDQPPLPAPQIPT